MKGIDRKKFDEKKTLKRESDQSTNCTSHLHDEREKYNFQQLSERNKEEISTRNNDPVLKREPKKQNPLKNRYE